MNKTAHHKAGECPLVWVEWVDSSQPMGRWRFLHDVKPTAAMKCVSVGFLLHTEGDAVMLAPNMGGYDEPDEIQANGTMTIPKRAITRISEVIEDAKLLYVPGVKQA
jgi:hypothetical protein